MKEDFVSFDQAKALKELGFPQDTEFGYSESKLVYPKKYDFVSLALPTLSQVQKWLREEKNLHIIPLYESWPNIHYHLQINDDDILYQDSPGYSYPQDYENYEEALSSGIDKCIELLLQ